MTTEPNSTTFTLVSVYHTWNSIDMFINDFDTKVSPQFLIKVRDC